MAWGFETEPAQVVALGAQSLASSQGLADALLTAQEAMSVAATGFGDTPCGAGLRRSYLSATSHGGTLIGRFADVLAGDCDRLYQTAFYYQSEDEAAADMMNGLGDVP